MRLHHLALRTHDVDRLVAFYRDVLALEPWPVQAGSGVWLQLDGAVLMIERAGADEPPPPPGTRELLALLATDGDLTRARAHLATHGVTIEAETAHTLYFRDPDGRRVALSDYTFPPPHERKDTMTERAPLRDHASPLELLRSASAVEVAARIRRRTVSSREMVDACIAEVERVNPTLNAVVATRFDEARAEAELADRRLASEDAASLPPLHGVPCTIKECFALVGMPQTSGLPARVGFRPSADAPAVTRLRDAGRHPGGRHQRVRAVHVDGELQPGLRAHQQPLRPEPDRGRQLRWRRRHRGVGRQPLRAGLRRGRLHPHAGVLQRRVRPQMQRGPHPQQRAVPRGRRRRGQLPQHGPHRAARRGLEHAGAHPGRPPRERRQHQAHPPAGPHPGGPLAGARPQRAR
jgi:catechol 2,3-dioxygenase-like lactoylglutathione lyase family enzyme